MTGPDDFQMNEEVGFLLPDEALRETFQRVGINNGVDGPGLATTLAMIDQVSRPVQDGGFAAMNDDRMNDPAIYRSAGVPDQAINETVNGPGRLPDDTCVVIMRTDESARHVHSGLYGGAEPPGTEQDWQLYMGAHELDHCENMSRPFHEHRSDQAANNSYARDLAEGRATDPEVPYYGRDARATATMLGLGGDDYATGGIVPLAGEAPLTDAQLKIAEAQIQEAAMLPRQSILDRGGDIPDIETDPQLYSQAVYEETRYLLERGDFDDMPYGKQVAERFVDGAQRYGQEYYNVAPEDAINTPPAIPQVTRDYAPQPAAGIQRPAVTDMNP